MVANYFFIGLAVVSVLGAIFISIYDRNSKKRNIA
jgi:hypothetical protein